MELSEKVMSQGSLQQGRCARVSHLYPGEKWDVWKLYKVEKETKCLLLKMRSYGSHVIRGILRHASHVMLLIRKYLRLLSKASCEELAPTSGRVVPQGSYDASYDYGNTILYN